MPAGAQLSTRHAALARKESVDLLGVRRKCRRSNAPGRAGPRASGRGTGRLLSLRARHPPGVPDERRSAPAVGLHGDRSIGCPLVVPALGSPPVPAPCWWLADRRRPSQHPSDALAADDPGETYAPWPRAPVGYAAMRGRRERSGWRQGWRSAGSSRRRSPGTCGSDPDVPVRWTWRSCTAAPCRGSARCRPGSRTSSRGLPRVRAPLQRVAEVGVHRVLRG